MGTKTNQLEFVFRPEIKAKLIELLQEKDPTGKEAAAFAEEYAFVEKLAQQEDDLELVNFWNCRGTVIRSPGVARTINFAPAVDKVLDNERLCFKNYLQHLADHFSSGIVGSAKNLEYIKTTKNGFIFYSATADIVAPNKKTQRFELDVWPSLVVQRDGIYAQIGAEDEQNAKVLTYANGDKKSGRRLLEDFMEFIVTMLSEFECVYGSVADHANRSEQVYGGIQNRFQKTPEGISKMAHCYRRIGGLLEVYDDDRRPMVYFYADQQDGVDIWGKDCYSKMNPNLNIYHYEKIKKPKIQRRTKPQPVEAIPEKK